MKTVKLGLLTVFLAFAALGFAIDDNAVYNHTRQVKISIEDACQSRGLVYAINNQLQESMLETQRDGGLIIFKVRYHKTVYHVFGTYKQWKDYFYRSKFVRLSDL